MNENLFHLPKSQDAGACREEYTRHPEVEDLSFEPQCMDEMVQSPLMSGMQRQEASESTSVWGHMREFCQGLRQASNALSRNY